MLLLTCCSAWPQDCGDFLLFDCPDPITLQCSLLSLLSEDIMNHKADNTYHRTAITGSQIQLDVSQLLSLSNSVNFLGPCGVILMTVLLA